MQFKLATICSRCGEREMKVIKHQIFGGFPQSFKVPDEAHGWGAATVSRLLVKSPEKFPFLQE